MKQRLMPNGEPFYYPGNKTGILCVHGFVGTPDEIREMGKAMAQRGYTVLGIRLFAHSTNPADMRRAHWQDWVADIEDSLIFLSAVCDDIFICGLSMGGTLSLYAAAHYLQIKGVIAMSAPMDMVPQWLETPVILLSKIFPMLDLALFRKILLPKHRQHLDKLLEEAIGYHCIAPAAFGELLKLIRAARTALPVIQTPTLLIQAHGDPLVDFHNGTLIFDTLTCAGKQHLWLEENRHTVTEGPEKEKVYATTHDFIQRALKG